MATRQEAQEHVIDLILNFIITNAVDASSGGNAIDLSSYRRYIDPNTGQIVTDENISSNDTSIVLYERDFRESFDEKLIEAVDEILDNCGTVSGDNYDLDFFDSDGWEYVPGGTTCDQFTETFGGISFSGYTTLTTYLTGTECLITPGQMACGADGYHAINLSLTDGVLTSLSQFITITQQQTDIDGDLDDEILDTNIYELLPGGTSRQEQIDKFFSDYANLKGSVPDTWDQDFDQDGVQDHWSNPALDTTYTQDHDITFNPLEGFIPRLNTDAAETENEGQTLQFLRDDLNNFLLDIDTPVDMEDTDDRLEYENQSGGYLKFRGLNQGIIIRSTEGTGVGLEKYYETGFTITMWVRFLDKVSSGTLFNYGNPLRTTSPTGFMLETFMDDSDTDNRYIRLVLRDAEVGGFLRDSHVGISGTNRIDTKDLANLDDITSATYTSVPIDFSEWYFIVATFDTTVDTYTASSDYGAKCKVEVISKSDLTRARGYGV